MSAGARDRRLVAKVPILVALTKDDAERSGMTVNEFCARLAADERWVGYMATAVGRIPDTALPQGICRHCGRPVVQGGDMWFHADPGLSRGCRSAAYDPDGDDSRYDESIPSHWRATPGGGK